MDNNLWNLGVATVFMIIGFPLYIVDEIFGTYTLTIIDNGMGFGLIDKTKILTPYYTTKKEGTGLGLAIVTKIISDHNGTILFNSIKNGAKVDIILPKYYD